MTSQKATHPGTLNDSVLLNRSLKIVLPLLLTISIWLVGAFVNNGMAAPEGSEAGAYADSWLSILPPLLAIAIALIFRQVLFALFLGIWIGAFLIEGVSLMSVCTSFFYTLSDFIVPAMADVDHMSIIVFSLLIGGMIGVITENGGTRGIVQKLTHLVQTKIKGQVSTSLMGFLVFFDDYANTMVVGNTMRPLTDKLKISRAKLAYLVDSTAAPVATIALISTWIGAMVAYIADAETGLSGFNQSAYLVFINSLPYNFYAFFTIFFVLLISWSGLDFGPMLKSRITLYKAEHDPKLDKYNLYKHFIKKDEETQKVSNWINAAIPIAILIIGTVAGLFITGEGSSIQDIVASADSYAALLWGSLLALAAAIAMTIIQRLLDVEKMIEGMMDGMHTMFDGLIILVLAWALSAITNELGTADYLVSVLDETLDPFWMPTLIFILSGLTSFATGSSWGTMGILMPLVLPLVWSMGMSAGLDPETIHPLIYASVSGVLAGSVWGDHCSPISDTTILSSLATQCDHIEHVRTQMPYSMVGGSIAILATIAVMVLGMSWWLAYIIGIGMMISVVYFFGKYPVPDDYNPNNGTETTSSPENT